MTTLIHNLSENLIFHILSFNTKELDDIMCISTLNKTFHKFANSDRIAIIYYKILYNVMNKENKLTIYSSKLRNMPSFKYWFAECYKKKMISGFAIVNTNEFKESLKILKKYRLTNDKKKKIKMKWYSVDYLSWPSMPAPTTGQQGIRYIIF